MQRIITPTTPTALSPAVLTPEVQAMKAKLKATWMAGNYDYFSRFMESSATDFLTRLPVRKGSTLLDVACGSGQVALLAARQGARVVGIDIAENSIQAARGRAQSEGLDARFDEGDAESLPYADASFEYVVSLYGAMFAPRPELVAAELLRVCRSGGVVALGNWTPEGFIGQMFKTFARFIAPSGMPAPVLWGSEEVVRQRLAAGVSKLELARVMYRFDYPFEPAAVVEFFRENYGPTTQAFASLSLSDQATLRSALTQHWQMHNQATTPDRTVVDAEYLMVIGTVA
jgi:SAM-dependent methyltransferase